MLIDYEIIYTKPHPSILMFSAEELRRIKRVSSFFIFQFNSQRCAKTATQGSENTNLQF